MRRLTKQTREILLDKLFWYSGYCLKDFKHMNDEELYNFAKRMFRMGIKWKSKVISEIHQDLLHDCEEELNADDLIEKEFLTDYK